MATLISHQIKIDRARKLATTGRYPASFAAMVEALPSSTFEGLSARALAELVDAAWALAQNSKALAARDACGDGAVWDALRGEFRELRA